MVGSIKGGHYDSVFVQEFLVCTRRAASWSQPGIIHHRVLGKKLARSRVFSIIYEECQAGKCVLNIDAILETRPSRLEQLAIGHGITSMVTGHSCTGSADRKSTRLNSRH